METEALHTEHQFLISILSPFPSHCPALQPKILVSPALAAPAPQAPRAQRQMEAPEPGGPTPTWAFIYSLTFATALQLLGGQEWAFDAPR
jgi:hypothetical protein